MKLQATIGGLVMQVVGLQESLEKSYELLAQCIRSGQIPQEDVPKLLEQNKDFAQWYKNKWQSP